jgi:hypothetical protein
MTFTRLLIALSIVTFTAIEANAQKAPGVGLKVIFFLDPECPVSNAYMREIKNIYTEYNSQNVAFEAIFPVSTVKKEDIRNFLKKYNTGFPGYQDPELQKVRRYHATVMPQAVLINANGVIIYSGAIDNWYYALGKHRVKATEGYLRNAIEATLKGEPLLLRKTDAIGCLINL